MLELNKIYNMDCMEGIKLLEDKSIDLVVTDPPYILKITKMKKPTSMNNYSNELVGLKDGFDLKILDLLIPKMKKINIYIYCSRLQLQMLLEYFDKLKCNLDLLVWWKQNPSPLTNNKYLNDLEYVLFFREKGVKLFGNYHTKKKCYISGTNQVDKKKWIHPTIKPLPFIENHIINSSKEGDVVLDMFAGSGTTLVGAINTNRQFIGFEKEEKYYEIAKGRIEEAIYQKGISN